jgi:hypothetical protein
MKRKTTSQVADATEAAADAPAAPAADPPGAARTNAIAEECARIAGECASVAAPKAADPSVRPAAEAVSKAASAQHAGAGASPARKDPPALPRAATLPPASDAEPRAKTPVAAPPRAAPAAPVDDARPRRFALLAACVALSAALGALGGSFALGGIGHLLAAKTPPAQADAAEEIRALKDSVAQLRGNLKAIGDNVAAVRAGLNASFSSSTAQFAKIEQAIEKLHQAERHAAAAPAPAPAPEATGSIAAAPPAKPANPVVEGWVLRKAYRGAALVEGRYGIIEIEPGDMLPGVGRVEDIKRQDGRWVVVTARGLIVGAQ